MPKDKYTVICLSHISTKEQWEIVIALKGIEVYGCTLHLHMHGDTTTSISEDQQISSISTQDCLVPLDRCLHGLN